MTLEGLTEGERVGVERASATVDEALGAVTVWEEMGELSCAVQRVRAEVEMRLGRAGVKATHVFYFASNPAVDSRHRLVWRGRWFYDLRQTDMGGQGRAWAVWGREIEPDGRQDEA